jgi:hypothetical protein
LFACPSAEPGIVNVNSYFTSPQLEELFGKRRNSAAGAALGAVLLAAECPFFSSYEELKAYLKQHGFEWTDSLQPDKMSFALAVEQSRS